MKVHEAIVKVREDVGAVRKDGRNTQQNFNFRGVDAVVNAVSAAMSKHGVMVFPSKVEHRDASKQLSGGKVATAPVLIVDYTFIGPEGDQFVAQVPAESFDLGDKATAKAMSVAYRTCLLQVFTLPTDDSDPDADTYERAQRPQPQQQGTDWAAALVNAKGNLERLTALRHTAKHAGAPDHYMGAVEASIQEATPIEGVLANA
ncbi:ERF superfamily protein [Arthrobacter sp. 9V]|uniref:ERF family protein n=1 Tax=Arthrobacter sp. 9V TaxID=2653132 RepID=UPI0012F0A4A0|nr:ERF family protein [Arthrobacter sp. 9V]VXB25716.1 ERF superfamily protein [Arthrobacter sp. 9V]